MLTIVKYKKLCHRVAVPIVYSVYSSVSACPLDPFRVSMRSTLFSNNTKMIFAFLPRWHLHWRVGKQRWVNCWFLAWIKEVSPDYISSHCILLCHALTRQTNASFSYEYLDEEIKIILLNLNPWVCFFLVFYVTKWEVRIK